MVSFVTPTRTEPLGFTPASMMSWSHTNMTQPMTFAISKRLWRALFCNSGHEDSSCNPEQHKQFCTPGGGLLCLSPVRSLLPVSFAVTSGAKDDVRLGFGGSFVPFCFCLLLSPVVVIRTAPANPGSFLIAACRLPPWQDLPDLDSFTFL